MGVAKPAVAAAQQHPALPRPGKVGDHRLAVLAEDLRPHRHAQHEFAAARAGAVAAGAAAPVRRAEMLLVTIVDQRVEIVLGDDHDSAALAAVAAVRATELDEFLAPKAHRAAPAVAALHIDLALVEKFRHGAVQMRRAEVNKKGSGEPLPVSPLYGELAIRRGFRHAGRTEMNMRPPSPLWNLTAPSITANSVWSRPMPPTCAPGWNLRCRAARTMMLPETTISPPEFL